MLEFGAGFYRLVFFWVWFALLWLAEWIFPYRPPSQPKVKRLAVNLLLTGINNAVLALVFGTAVMAVSWHASQKGLGFLNLWELPYWFKTLAAVVFLDFMLYVWHLLNHEVPLLWRFHRVHHSDLNMDVTTATRFHLGELLPSALIKMGLVYLSGADPTAVLLFEVLVVATAQFHHSSLKVPVWFEKAFWVLFVPPSMHRIHHSVKIKERDSNYGTIFSLWDRLMGTLVKEVDQARIVIGVGGHFDAAKLGLGHLLAMPFRGKVK